MFPFTGMRLVVLRYFLTISEERDARVFYGRQFRLF